MLNSGLHIGWGIWRVLFAGVWQFTNTGIVIFTLMSWYVGAFLGGFAGAILLPILRKDTIYVSFRHFIHLGQLNQIAIVNVFSKYQQQF